ncbi:zinc finger protein 883-like [Diorhabda carinulata]|uniref:zinc finger protein 883-like n=1 Tax=Diorhabda carinulata TaxID=1163345 RepID=UPI0025A1EC79|nr:zinc finger protein 883-like [Diorhabda carinulata]
MGTLSLKCPLCCGEHFSSRQLLRDHILEVINNPACSICNSGFNNINELANHLETECDAQLTNLDGRNENQDNDGIEKETEGSVVHSDKEIHEVTETEQGKTDSENCTTEDAVNFDTQGDNGQVTYMCIMCNVQFTSIEEHLAKYHDGEEVMLETEEFDPEGEQELEVDQSIKVEQENNFELSQNSADENEQYIIEDDNDDQDEEPRDPTWEMQNHNLAPFTENYQIENGNLRKITEEEAAEISDHNSIIQIHQCPKCYLQFPKFDHYIKHNCIPGKMRKRHKCVYCSAVFESQESLNTHLNFHINPTSDATPSKVITLAPHLCDICNTMFPSFKSLRLHKRMHEPMKRKEITPGSGDPDGRPMFTCNICGETYGLEFKKIHMESHSDKDNFFCTTCNRQFDSQENLEMHMKAHNNSKKFLCSYCKKAFTTYGALHDHVSNQCQNRHYECQYCGRRFSRPHEKVKHERIHTGEKPHVCQICGKAFRVSYCLTLHMRTHSGTRPYECPHCNKRFKSHSVYNHHLLIHSDVRAYKCSYCPKTFKTSVQLAGHKNSHIKPFSCTECNRPFASLYAVRAHMETHKRENNLKFDCWLCGATYARAFALKDHMKTQHSGEEVLVEIETEDTDENNLLKEEESATEEILK